LFFECAELYSSIVKHLFNIILATGNCPTTLKPAVATPIPAVNQPTAYKDLRPMSVTPTLSRLF
jgi:hypothetical protein